MNERLLKIKIYLHHRFKNHLDRLNHIYSVNKMAVLLGEIYGVKLNKVKMAALLHDVTKYDSINKINIMAREWVGERALKGVPLGCLHAYSAAQLAKKYFHIDDQDLLNAITYHCSGKQDMSLLQQIIFVSDYIEETRSFIDESLRKIAKEDIDLATLIILKNTINYLKNNDRDVSGLTLKALTYYQNKSGVMNEHSFKKCI
ncbi:MAG TPA: bis(5'-nucleosyl)-tetraphosphatase (symmetrical) YqeK [Candidatus Izemoplasmatales bacterium]|nr:bis(5'-nucleosyl)-tetraphosphatase (symmetrical) YqeK [Candidatus Izemoplasmatales bacterium]